jgi:beta-glucosidase
MRNFPVDFLFGAASAAHQVEGNNTNSDFWAMEQVPGGMFKEPSLDSVDHYNRYKEDIDLMAGAGLNTYRFSIEWARIQPARDTFDAKEMAHYRDVLQYCRDKGITPVVTMHHFSSPKWLIEDGGWEDETTVTRFAYYCAHVAKNLGPLMKYVCTINEANMGLQMAKIIKDMARSMMPQVQVGIQPDIGEIMAARMGGMSEVFGGIEPRKIAFFLSGRSEQGDILIMKAHEAARDAMKAICPHLKIGVTLSIYNYQIQSSGEEMARKELEDDFLHYLPYLQKDDFFGLQNYTRKLIGPEGSLPPPEGAELTDMGYEFYPQALANIVRTVAQHLRKPIMVTENGIATGDDTRRVVFIREALSGLQQCIKAGIPVIGYMHWSVLDNFEWMLGFEKRFGLIAVDRTTQKRMPKESLHYLGKIARSGVVE